jgi:hypothetical protein
MTNYTSSFANGAAVDALLKQIPSINNTNKRSHVIAGVIRYNATTQAWEQITGAHDPLNTTSITCPTDTTIQINFGLATVANKKVITFVANADEELAGMGLFIGASVGVNDATLNIYSGAHGSYVYYNGSAWAEIKGSSFPSSSFSWSTNHLVITIPFGLITAYVRNWPMVCARDGGYNVKLGSVGDTTIEVYFYNAAGTLITTPDTSMKCYVNYGIRKIKTKGDYGLPDAFGNIWYFGIIEGDP